jgi:DNA-binding LacI/PurR family transcriptional regulator
MAGVSQTTVSLVLNDADGTRGRVGPDVRQRVLQAIEMTGYAANPAAQSLAGGRTSIIGVHTYEPVFPHAAGNFYYPFLEGIEDEAQRLGVDLLLFTSMTSAGQSLTSGAGVRRLRMADGCVLLGRHSYPEDLAELLRQDFPFAFVGRRAAPGGQVPFAAAAYDVATQRVVEHLLALGHRRVAMVNGYTGHESVEDRADGYTRAMRAAGLSPVSLSGNEQDPHSVVDAILESRTTAVVAAADLAAPVRTAALERGLTVPGDLSIARLGDPEIPEPVDVDWTGFLIPRVEMGAEALRTVMRRIAGDDADSQTFIPCTVVEGSTVARIDQPASRPATD